MSLLTVTFVTHLCDRLIMDLSLTEFMDVIVTFFVTINYLIRRLSSLFRCVD